MYDLDKERARQILLDENLTLQQIDRLLMHFPPIHQPLGDLVNQWLTTGVIPDMEIEGITLKDIMNNRQCHFLVAVRDLNKFLDPEMTLEKRERWRRILTSPIFIE